MSLVTFILDRSSTARLLNSIDAWDRSVETLRYLKEIVLRDLQILPCGYLEQTLRRAEVALMQAKTEEEGELLQVIRMRALRRIQRVHLEKRP